MNRLILLYLAILFASLAKAQPVFQVTDYSTENGLSQDLVSAVIQDHNGFIWIATRNGLNKYDGYTFKHYKGDSHADNSLSNNRIITITQTVKGDIWCQTYDNRAFIFDTYTEKFHDVLRDVDRRMMRENQVRKIFSLPKGIAWICCDAGYCYRVDERTYKQASGIQVYGSFNHSVKGKHIYTVFQDSQEDEWILTDQGITIVGHKSIRSDFPFQFIQEHDGKLALGSVTGKLALYNPEKMDVEFLPIPSSVRRIQSMTFTSSGSLVALTERGILLWKELADTPSLVETPPAFRSSSEIVPIYEDREGTIWIFSSPKGVLHFCPESLEVHSLTAPDWDSKEYTGDKGTIAFEDAYGTLWLKTRNSNLCYYDREYDKLKPLFLETGEGQQQFCPQAHDCFVDQQGNAWLICARGVKKMSFFPNIYRLNCIDKGYDVRAFLCDTLRRLWVGSKSGYLRIYGPDGRLEGYMSPKGEIHSRPIPFDKVYCIYEDRDGTIWIGTRGSGLYCFTPSSHARYTVRQYRHQAQDPYSLGSDDVYTVYADECGHIWIGCYGGGLNLLERGDDGTARFVNYRNRLKNYPSAECSNVRHIGGTGSGVILVATTSGLLTFSNGFDEPEAIKFYRNTHDPDSISGLSANDVMHIFRSSGGDLYVLAFTGGINKIISPNLLNDKLQFRYYTEKDGLGSNLVLSMIEDSNQKLWIVSEDNLSKFDPMSEVFENYNTRFFRQKLHFTESVPTVNAMQKLVFGTDMGVLEIESAELTKSSYTPLVVFPEIKVNGRLLPNATDRLEQVTLAPAGRNLMVQFASLDFIRTEEIRYAYRLHGLEQDWNYNNDSRQATYINLPAGRYVLQVKSTNSDGVWCDNIRQLRVCVTPTFFETPWAWLVYIAAFILLIGIILYIFSYIFKLRHRVDLEKQLTDIKLRFFTDISHELRTPLTLIVSPITEVLENGNISASVREHLEVVRKNTERMLQLVNQLLDFRKIQNKRMKLMLEQTELIAFLMKISEHFRLVADERQIAFSFHAKTEELYLWIDRDKVEKIIFNLLSNAFKYTPAGKAITIEVECEEEHVHISIRDEGVGIAPEKMGLLFKRFETLGTRILQPSSGIGLSLVKELVDIHHGQITVESEVGTGSTFSVTLPIGQDAYREDPQAELVLADCLPIADENADSPSTTHSGESLEQEEERMTILIVEDNSELRRLLYNILSPKYLVLQAANGAEGLRMASSSIPDMILSDVMMPVMDGLEMIRNLKENPDTRYLPIILLSAKASLDDRIYGLEQGIDDYITKPFSSTYLKTRIESIFSKRRLLQELFVRQLSAQHGPSDAHEWTPSEPEVMPHDAIFMKEVMAYVEEQMDNSEMQIDDIARHLNMSRSIFYRKLKTIVGMPPVEFIREIRVKRAAQLINTHQYTFAQIAYMTGFCDPKYFSKSFKKHMGMSPSEYKKNTCPATPGEDTGETPDTDNTDGEDL